jgi:3-oxoadipate enol-lactonase
MPEMQANGLTFHYQWQGREDGPTVVLINGLLTDLSSWNGHLSYYTDKFHLLTYDCRGQGGTDKPDDGPYPPRLHAEDLKALLDGLNIPQAALVGVSSGACAALDFASRWPQRTTALVSANGYGKADTIMQVKLTAWVNAMAAGGGPLRFDVSSPWIWGATFLNNNFEALKPFREKGSTLPIYAARHLIEGGMDHDVLEQLPNVTCPTLLMTGDEDVLTPLSYSHAIQRRIAGSRLVMLENAGHCMFLERVSRFAEVASGFLAESLL